MTAALIIAVTALALGSLACPVMLMRQRRPGPGPARVRAARSPHDIPVQDELGRWRDGRTQRWARAPGGTRLISTSRRGQGE